MKSASFRQRLLVAALALAISLPVGCVAALYLLDRNFFENHSGMPIWNRPTVVWLAFLVLGSVWVYEITSRITGGRIDGHPIPVGPMATGTVAGLLAGPFLVRQQPIYGSLVLALLGGLAGTYVPWNSSSRKGRDALPRRTSDGDEVGQGIAASEPGVRVQPSFVLERVSVHLAGDGKIGFTTTVSAEVSVVNCPSAQITHAHLDVGGAGCGRKLDPLWVASGEATRMSLSVEGSWLGEGRLTVLGIDDGGIGVQGSARLA